MQGRQGACDGNGSTGNFPCLLGQIACYAVQFAEFFFDVLLGQIAADNAIRIQGDDIGTGLDVIQVDLPDNEYLVKELCALERRRGRSGKDHVDHPPRGRDDLANAVAGAAYEGFKFTDLIFPELSARSAREALNV